MNDKLLCGTHNCDNQANQQVHWPGKTLLLCESCTQRAHSIAEAMGFVLSATRLEGGPDADRLE